VTLRFSRTLDRFLDGFIAITVLALGLAVLYVALLAVHALVSNPGVVLVFASVMGSAYSLGWLAERLGL
jgi:hypothetical protein